MRKRAMTMLGFFAAFAVFLLLGLTLINNSESTRPFGFASVGLAALMIVAVGVYDVSGRIQPGWVKQVSASGVEASAVILENNAMQGIGGYKGGDLWLDLPVRVQPAGGTAFEAQMKCRLSQTFMLQNGGTVTVRYNPANTRQVVLVGNSVTDMFTKHL